MRPSIVTKLLEYQHDLGFLSFCLLSASIIRAYISPGERSLKTVLTSFLCVLPVGFVAGYMAMENGLPDSWVMLIVLVCGFYGNSFLRAAADNESFLGSLLKRVIENLTDKFTGK